MLIAVNISKDEEEALLDYELSKRAILDQLAEMVRTKWKEDVWTDGFEFDVVFLDGTYDSGTIEREQEFFEENIAQFFLEIIGVLVSVSFLKNELPCGGHTCRFEIRRRE